MLTAVYALSGVATTTATISHLAVMAVKDAWSSNNWPTLVCSIPCFTSWSPMDCRSLSLSTAP